LLGYLRKKLCDFPERGMALKVFQIFSLLWQSFKGANYSVWIAFLPFSNKNSNVSETLDMKN